MNITIKMPDDTELKIDTIDFSSQHDRLAYLGLLATAKAGQKSADANLTHNRAQFMVQIIGSKGATAEWMCRLQFEQTPSYLELHQKIVSAEYAVVVLEGIAQIYREQR